MPRLQTTMADFDPDTRDRFIAGSVLPAHWYTKAQHTRKLYLDAALKVFEKYDVLIAPATPCTAPKMGEKELKIGNNTVPLRPNLGYFTQPISAIGLPCVTIPTLDPTHNLPIGVQIIAAPWREDLCLQVAHYLEKQGFQAAIPTGISSAEFETA